jgi:hypothetical protein
LAAAACLLVLAAVFLYRDSRGTLNRGGQVAKSIESANGAASKPDDKSMAAVETGGGIITNTTPGEPHRANIARAAGKQSRRQDIASSEGERAKQQLELALYIASSKLNLAEKAVARLNQEDQPAGSPEHDEHRMDR